jgi:predicted acyltransferase
MTSAPRQSSIMARADPPGRIASLDQFRGYTILGMFLVNFAGGFLILPDTIRHHHTFCSYADTIMPQFFFAVGFAYRLTLLRYRDTLGTRAAYGRVLRRNLGLLLLGLVFHGLDGGARSWEELCTLGVDGFLLTGFQRKPFQTLVHIAVTALWILPVIAARPAWRIAWAVASAGLFWWLSERFYYTWVMTRPGIDGGPLGFLTWTTPMLAGSLAYDAVARGAPAAVGRLLGWGIVLMLLGYGLSCLARALDPSAESLLIEPPFVAPANSRELREQLSKIPENAPHMLWLMSQRAGSPSYLVFGAGFSMALYALFVWACDLHQLGVGLLRTFGTNALAAYIIHEMVGNTLRPFTPRDAPLWYALAAFGVFVAICYVFLRHLEKHRLFLRL